MSDADDALAAIPVAARDLLATCSRDHGLSVRWKVDREDVPELLLDNGNFTGLRRWKCVALVGGFAYVAGEGWGDVRAATVEALRYLAEHLPPAALDMARRARDGASRKGAGDQRSQRLAEAARYDGIATAAAKVVRDLVAAWPEADEAVR